MAKDEAKAQRKEIKRLRKKIDEMADLIEVQGEVMHDIHRQFGSINQQVAELHGRWARKAEQGNSGPPIMPGRQGIEERSQEEIDTLKRAWDRGPGRPVIGEETDRTIEWADPSSWQVGWDPEEGKPVRVASVTPNRDPEADEYTFWFTEEMCEQLGISDIQRHLVEHPNGGGRLVMVDGPPTKLAPEHREIVEALRDKGDSDE